MLIIYSNVNKRKAQPARDGYSHTPEMGAISHAVQVVDVRLSPLISPLTGILTSEITAISTPSLLSLADRKGSQRSSERLKMFQVPTRRALRRLTPGMERRAVTTSASPQLFQKEKVGLGSPPIIMFQGFHGLWLHPPTANPFSVQALWTPEGPTTPIRQWFQLGKAPQQNFPRFMEGVPAPASASVSTSGWRNFYVEGLQTLPQPVRLVTGTDC